MSPLDGAAAISDLTDAGGDSVVRDIWREPDMRIVADDRTPAPALLHEGLPSGWSEWIAAEATAQGCPPDYVAAGLIAGASAWVGNARHIGATPTWTEPPHVWFALIGAPSTGKTPALRPIIEASRTIERDAEPDWQAAMAEYKDRIEVARYAEEYSRERIRVAAREKRRFSSKPAVATPPPPPMPRALIMDTTTEALQLLLSEQPRGLLQIRDELAGWLGSHDRYGGNGGDRAFFLETWNGGAFVNDRVKRHGAPVRIARAALAIVGGMQPDRLQEALAGADDGLSARLAYIWPEPMPVLPLAVEPDPVARARRDQLVLAARLLHGLEMDSDGSGDPAPVFLRLDGDALPLFDRVRRGAIERARSSRGLAAGWHGKTPGRLLRLALVFELLAWAPREGPEPCAVGADAMARAAAYIDYLGKMLDRTTGGLAIGPAEADAAIIARYLLATRALYFNERDLYQQPGWSWLRKAERRTAAMRVLANAGWIRKSAAACGGRPRCDWDVSPKILVA